MKTPAARSLRVMHIHLENWRNFTSVNVDLQRRVFLVGPNASGKSNFLDAFRFLHDIVSVGGGFQAAVQTKRGGVSRLRCLAARRYADIVIRAVLGSEESPSAWKYELRFSQDNLQQPVIKAEIVEKDGSKILQRPDAADTKDSARLHQT